MLIRPYWTGGVSTPIQTQRMALPKTWASPPVTRSLTVLEIASGLVASPDRFGEPVVSLKVTGQKDRMLTLTPSSLSTSIPAVVNREVDLATINPAAVLTLAFRGTGIYNMPQPVRTIAVIPSSDQFVFAVKSSTGLRTFEEIAERKYPLRIALRGTPAHGIHVMLDDILAAAGFSLDDIRAWGGDFRRDGLFPTKDGPKFEALARGEIDAMFDEAVQEWVEEAVAAGMTILPLAEPTLKKLEAMGYRRAMIRKELYPSLPADVPTIDFSGWPIFVHAEMPDDWVSKICAGLDAGKERIPWQGEGPLPVERMCRDGEGTPLDVPLHPAAERFWRGRGYL